MLELFPFVTATGPRESSLVSDESLVMWRACDLTRFNSLISSSRGVRGNLQIPGMAHNKQRRLKSIIDFEFVKNVRQMGFYGFFANKYLLADLLVCQPLCY